MRSVLMLMAVGTFLAACDNADGPADADAVEKPAAPEETVFDPMVGTMDRAQGLEDTSRSRKDEMDAAIEGVE